MHKANCYDCAESNIILHAFDWPYAKIAEQAATIKAFGYKSVLISPPMKSLVHAKGTQWWQRYQPQDYRVIDNQLGDTLDFKAMIEALTQYDLWLYVDVVFNHMANEHHLREDLQYPSADEMAHYQSHQSRYDKLCLFGDLSQPLFTEGDFAEAFGIEDWKDRWQVQNGRISAGPDDPGLPTLKDNDHVVTQQKNYLKALKALGVRGFRIDAAKHMTLDHLTKVWTPDITDGLHIFGEIITDGGATEDEYELFLQPYLENTTLGAYDFPLFSTVFDAFQPEGDLTSLIDPYSLGQALSKSRAITFGVTHDIPNNDVFLDKVMDESAEWLAHAYLLGRDGGVPLIYADLDTSGIKGANGQPRWVDAWKDKRMQALNLFYHRMHGLRMEITAPSETALMIDRERQGFVLINKSDVPETFTLPIEAGHCLLTKSSVTSEVVVPANSFKLVFTN
ncbi:alpha-amylase family protein [Vibrio sp. SCSIO 43136]|uniref:alpha-amylase family protein n=1 Tax=Vibrio sp. SCSIO 43136 TaxID=2819101 RepID=UPI002075DF79|nr:alpha-amylase family protein [Vibrio sp. SCSIO 43136]USD67662.1 alpha-amylase family protein [Vibrio sp. SCSIO 43136]